MNQPAEQADKTGNKTAPPALSYHVWDRTIRIFHWLNVVCVTGLIGVGLMIFFSKNLGVSSDGKILLKTIHAYIGYVFVLNLSWRIVWGFFGNIHSRWKTILPFGKDYRSALTAYVRGLKNGDTPAYLGHNPLARLMVTVLFLLLISQATTGLVLAGTDLYLPPFGHEIAEWAAGSGEDHSQLKDLKPGSKDAVDPQGYEEMRAMRKPYILIHQYGFYLLVAALLIHILGVVVTELREKNGLVSAMITGNKVFTKKPVDLVESNAESKNEGGTQ